MRHEPERTCIVSRTVRPAAAMIRFVLGPDGAVLSTIQPAGQAQPQSGLPTGLALASDTELYVAESRTGFVYRLPVPR